MDMIACADARWGIGRQGKLLYRLPPDMKRFRELTMGKVLVMGSKTLATLPGGMPLPGRKANIVLTSNTEFFIPGAAIVHTLDELFDILNSFDLGEVFVIGGAKVYAQLAPYCKKALITRVNKIESDADAVMLNLEETPGWRVEKRTPPMWFDDTEYEYIDYVNENVMQIGNRK